MELEFFEIGRIVNTQGIHGDLRVIPITDEPKRFLDLKTVLIDDGKSLQEYSIENIWFHKQFVIIKFNNIDDMTTAQKLKGTSIKINRKYAIALKENEYFIKDLYDIEVFTDENEYLGIIKDIIFTAANDVYVINNPDNESKEILIPAIKQCIKQVDIQNKKMIVHLIDGLI